MNFRSLPVVGVMFGSVLVLLPLLTDVWFAWEANRVIKTMTSRVDEQTAREVAEQVKQAHAYNDLVARRKPGIPPEEVWPYERQLRGRGEHMGWLEIPKIDVRLPVSHGTSERALSNGAGHVRSTALPVGALAGRPCHCVISAHSGLRTARMFDDLRRLVPGDKVCVHVLGGALAYEVIECEVVLPERVDRLELYSTDVADMLTLVTCTPLGINDHRLLVHCKRVPYCANDFDDVPTSAFVNGRTVPPIVVGAMVVVACARMCMRRGYVGQREDKP